jgi:hypothetical protein
VNRLTASCLTASCLTAALTLLAMSPATAAETSPRITPSVFAPGSSPSLQVDYTVTSAVTLDPGRLVWDLGIGFDGATIAGDLNVAPQVDVASGVITCDFGGGISGSFTSTDLAALDVDWCYLFVDSVVSSPTQGWVYFAVAFSDPLPTPATPIPVTARLGAGAFTFPVAEGTYDYEAYTWNTDYVDRTVSTYRVGYTAGSTEIRHLQGLPMPASGDCADVQDAAYAWGTGLKGGWTKAWEPWVHASAPEGQRGGWACTRSLVNRGGDTWVIG